MLESTLFLNLIPGVLLGSWNQCIRVVRSFDDDKRDCNIVHVLTGGIQTLNYTCIVDFSTFIFEISSMTRIAVSQLWTWQGGLFKSTCDVIMCSVDRTGAHCGSCAFRKFRYICFLLHSGKGSKEAPKQWQRCSSLKWTKLKMSRNVGLQKNLHLSPSVRWLFRHAIYDIDRYQNVLSASVQWTKTVCRGSRALRPVSIY